MFALPVVNYDGCRYLHLSMQTAGNLKSTLKLGWGVRWHGRIHTSVRGAGVATYSLSGSYSFIGLEAPAVVRLRLVWGVFRMSHGWIRESKYG